MSADCPPEQYAGHSTVIVYPMWPIVHHPRVEDASQHVVRFGEATYDGPDAVGPPTPLRSERLPERDRQHRLFGLAERQAEHEKADRETGAALADFAGAAPPLPALPLAVELFRVVGEPLDYCGTPVRVVALAAAAGEPARATLKYAQANVHVLLCAHEPTSRHLGRADLIARRIGWLAPTWLPSERR